MKTLARQQILECAARHFADKGFEGARVDEIAEASGVNKATIYYHHGNKLELYRKLLEQPIQATVTLARQTVNDAATPEQQLRAYIESIASAMQGEHSYFPGMLMREILCGGEHLPDDMLRQMLQLKDILAGILERGHAAGRFRPANPFTTHLLITGTLMIHATGEPLRRRMQTLDRHGDCAHCQLPLSQMVAEVTDMVTHSLRLRPTGEPE